MNNVVKHLYRYLTKSTRVNCLENSKLCDVKVFMVPDKYMPDRMNAIFVYNYKNSIRVSPMHSIKYDHKLYINSIKIRKKNEA